MQQRHDDRPPRGEQDVAERVGHGVAERGQRALRFLLDRAETGGDGSRPAAGSQQDHGIHLQDESPEEDRGEN